ncbi:MAG: protein translocase subunit SecF [Synergistaceae bacterium]|jgi:preprotein translocase subunit SecF|nr:protein translocase subunit SecF [Synergistaceae bacterium]
MTTFNVSKMNLPFMKYRMAAIVLSAALVLSSLLLLAVKGLNYSVDFTGGMSMQIEFENPVEVAAVRETLSGIGQGQATIQAYDDKNVLVRYQGSDDALRRQIMSALEEGHGALAVRQIDDVGPVVGSELRKQAFIAVLVSIAAILLYMAVRFQPRFGVVAVVSLAHDAMIMLGIYSLTGREISTSFIAAVLTVIGYSLNDSIVVLDRIRENWPQVRSKGILELINTSINQTLSRTINTALTTLLPVLAMFFLGGEVISNLAFAFLVGIVVGTYSSIYVASSLLAEWFLRKPLRR